MAKQPTPQGISALLRKAGHKRSQASKSHIKGMTEHSEGYEVYKHPDRDGIVYVKHRPGILYRGVQAQVREHEKLTAYGESIKSAGFKVQQDQVGSSVSLIVSAAEEG